jgi:ABC-2 type transport system permease protein
MTTDRSLTMPAPRVPGQQPDGTDARPGDGAQRDIEAGRPAGSGRPASSIRQASVILTARYLRQLYRVPVVIFMTLTQPVIWLLLFGALFKKVAEIPGFGGGNYLTYLTPGVVIMTAMFSASWAGMAYIEDMQNGVMDRFLTAPVGRGALTTAMLSYQGLTTVLQSAIIIAIGWGTGATFPGGAAGIAALIGVSVLIAVAMAGISCWFALLTRQREALIGRHRGAAVFLSARSVAAAGPGSPTEGARQVAGGNAGPTAIESLPACVTIAAYSGYLTAAVAVTAIAATRAFRSYQRSL